MGQKEKNMGESCVPMLRTLSQKISQDAALGILRGSPLHGKVVIISATLTVASAWFLGLIRSSAFLVPHHCSSSARVLFPCHHPSCCPPLVVGLVVLVPVDHVFDGLEEIALPRSLGRPHLHS